MQRLSGMLACRICPSLDQSPTFYGDVASSPLNAWRSFVESAKSHAAATPMRCVRVWPARRRILVQRKRFCLYINALLSSLLHLARVAFELGSTVIAARSRVFGDGQNYLCSAGMNAPCAARIWAVLRCFKRLGQIPAKIAFSSTILALLGKAGRRLHSGLFPCVRFLQNPCSLFFPATKCPTHPK